MLSNNCYILTKHENIQTVQQQQQQQQLFFIHFTLNSQFAMAFRGGMVKALALYTKARRFEPHRRRFFTPTVVLLSFKKPETVLWTIAKILLLSLL